MLTGSTHFNTIWRRLRTGDIPFANNTQVGISWCVGWVRGGGGRIGFLDNRIFFFKNSYWSLSYRGNSWWGGKPKHHLQNVHFLFSTKVQNQKLVFTNTFMAFFSFTFFGFTAALMVWNKHMYETRFPKCIQKHKTNLNINMSLNSSHKYPAFGTFVT